MSTLPPAVTVSSVPPDLVLIVDDTPANLEVISESLSHAGFDVAIATSGERALQQVERRTPDLILLDVMMPGLDGFETCRQLKANPRTCQIPIIFMTALSDPDSKVQALELGAVDYIAKPFHEKEVIARVRTHLQLHHLTKTLEMQVAKKTAALQASQLQLIQQEKMSALGNLVAGVAHEINNPIGCVLGNVDALLDSINDLFDVIDLYRRKFPQAEAEIDAKLEEVDLEYLREDLPKLVRAMQEGGDRIKSISKSLRTFSRSDSDRLQTFNLQDGIESTLMILHHRLKANQHRPEIEVIVHSGELPKIACFPGQLNQVFMNILANAIDVFDEAAQHTTFANLQAHPQILTIRTGLTAQHNVEIRIGDNGPGMTAAVKDRIFEYLFTTKEVGKGTGLGLAIAHQIIVEKHAGTLEVDSVVGQGTVFIITLPMGRI